MSLSAKQLFEDDGLDLGALLDEIEHDFNTKPMVNIRPAFEILTRLGYRRTPPWSESDIYGNEIALKEVKVSYDHRTHVICFEPSSPYDFVVVIRTLTGDEMRYAGGVIEFPITPASFQMTVRLIEESFIVDSAVDAEREMRYAFLRKQ